MGGGEGNAQAVAGQHHDDLFGVADGGEVFGVAAEEDAGIVDDTFVQRGGYHAGKFALADAAIGAIK